MRAFVAARAKFVMGGMMPLLFANALEYSPNRGYNNVSGAGRGAPGDTIANGDGNMIITNAKILLGDRFVTGVDVRVSGVNIAELGVALSGEDKLDAQGRVLAPGYCDIHIHGYGGYDTMDGAEAVLKMSEGLATHGCTSFLATTCSAPVEPSAFAVRGVKKAMQAQQAEGKHGATILGCHMEGPFLNDAKRGAQDPNGILKPSVETYEQIVGEAGDIVRLMTIAPEIEGARELCLYVRPGVKLAVGHTVATAEQVETAASWGCSQITHMFNGMNALHHREPGVPGQALADENYSVQMIADLVHLHRSALKLCYNAKGYEKCILITDAMAATCMGDGRYKLGALDVIVKNGEARLPEGNLAGSTLTIERAVKNMIETVKIPAEQALQMASRVPAQSIGMDDRGIIAVGKRADLVLLDADWSVNRTIVDGCTVYSK